MIESTNSLSKPADREQARKRLESRRSLSTDAVAYVVVNAFLVVVWALSGQGYFWPAWVMGAWGIGLAMHAWDAYFRKTVTESTVPPSHRSDGVYLDHFCVAIQNGKYLVLLDGVECDDHLGDTQRAEAF